MERPTDAQPTGDAATDDADKDLLRGGSGERGVPTDPVTNDDLLGGGSGVLPPDRDVDPDGPDDRGDSTR